MRNVMKEIAMNSIKDNEICIEDFGELILGDKCFIMPTKLNNVECYLKFFINPEIEAIKNEVKLLECLEDMQSPVMKLVKYKGKKYTITNIMKQ